MPRIMCNYCPECSHLTHAAVHTRCCPDSTLIEIPLDIAQQAKVGFAFAYLSIEDAVRLRREHLPKSGD